jgi:hypothetical protein
MSATNNTQDTSPQGVKHNRSPDPNGNLSTGDGLENDGTLSLIFLPS